MILLILPQFVVANSNLTIAIDWLKKNQREDGSYGSWTEHWTSPAMIALYKSEGNSSNVTTGLNWLKTQLEDSSSWFWETWGEADVPSISLYAFTQTDHLSDIDLSNISSNILSFQQMSGGFKGYYDPNLGSQVESSVDTTIAVLGLINANAIPEENKNKAVNYLLNLQNSDGSFNLTPTIQSDPLYSHAPEPISLTAMVLLTLKDCGLDTSNTSVLNGMNYLKNSATNCFDNHSYATALSSIVFDRFNELSYELIAINCLKSLQNPDGGFSDRIRTTNVSNALDTGWAAIALQKVTPLIKVGVLISFPNGTTFAHCLQLPNGSTAEDALKASGMKTLWASFSFGDALTKIEDVGCPTSDPWCQCSNMNVCCLLWNFWILNSTNQWKFSQVGFGDYKLKDKDVFGNIWASDAGKTPPLFLFDEICPDGFTINNNSFVGVYTCDSTTTTTITTTSVEVTTTVVEHGGGGMITTTTTQTTVPMTTTSIQTTTSTTFSPAPTTTSTVITNVTNNQLKPSPLTGFVGFIISPVGIGIIVAIVVLAFFVYLMLPER